MYVNGFIRRGVTFHVISFAALTVVRCRVCSLSLTYIYIIYIVIFSHTRYMEQQEARKVRESKYDEIRTKYKIKS